MNRLLMSRAASGLLRALLRRAGDHADRILLTEIQSCDWQSLTFTGERHVIDLRVSGPAALAIARTLLDGLEDAEFDIPGQIVADINCARGPTPGPDGSIDLVIEALSITE